MRNTFVTMLTASMLVAATVVGMPSPAQSQVIIIVGNGNDQPYYPQPYPYPHPYPPYPYHHHVVCGSCGGYYPPPYPYPTTNLLFTAAAIIPSTAITTAMTTTRLTELSRSDEKTQFD